MSARFLADGVRKNFNVMALAGTTTLSSEDLDAEIVLAAIVLEDKGNPRKEIVHWQPHSEKPPSPFVAVLVDKDNVTTMFIGLALEVIQAMQQAEK